MAIAFSVGGEVDQLRSPAGFGEPADEPLGESSSIVQQTLEGHALRNRAVIEEQLDLPL